MLGDHCGPGSIRLRQLRPPIICPVCMCHVTQPTAPIASHPPTPRLHFCGMDGLAASSPPHLVVGFRVTASSPCRSPTSGPSPAAGGLSRALSSSPPRPGKLRALKVHNDDYDVASSEPEDDDDWAAAAGALAVPEPRCGPWRVCDAGSRRQGHFTAMGRPAQRSEALARVAPRRHRVVTTWRLRKTSDGLAPPPAARTRPRTPAPGTSSGTRPWSTHVRY